MVGGDTGAVSAAGRGTGVRIFCCMRAAVDTHTNRDSYSYSHATAYDCAPAFSNPGAYSVPHTFAYHYARTSSIPAADPNSDPNAVGVIYIGSSSSYIPLNSAPNAYPNAGASGIHIYSILG